MSVLLVPILVGAIHVGGAAAALAGTSSSASSAGSVRALADFNGDAFADLAIGVPLESLGPDDTFAGAVNVIYGTPAGLSSANDQVWTQDSPGIHETSESLDHFGISLAGGDFDGDGYGDLAVGAPAENYTEPTAGVVHVIYGSPLGLTADGNELFSQDTGGIFGTAEPGDQFGTSLAAGDFGGSANDDLVIGVPYEDFAGADEGGVHVLYGGQDGLSGLRDAFFSQNTPGVPGTSESSDHFGLSLTAADFGTGFRDDLAIGVPHEDFLAGPDDGGVNVIYGSATGLTATRSQFWSQATPDVFGTAEPSDTFGASLAGGDFGRSVQADLAIGVPREGLSGQSLAGGVHVLYGSSGGLTAAGDDFWRQGLPGIDDTPEIGDQFGWALAAANFGKLHFADLAVGVPFENGGEGAVEVIYGSDVGLAARGNQLWSQDSVGILSSGRPNEYFGSSLAVGNFGGDIQADVAVGVPYEDLGSIDEGAVNVIYGGGGGLSAVGNQFWHQDSAGIGGASEANDRFGLILEALGP
jgi:hypothetical protein